MKLFLILLFSSLAFGQEVISQPDSVKPYLEHQYSLSVPFSSFSYGYTWGNHQISFDPKNHKITLDNTGQEEALFLLMDTVLGMQQQIMSMIEEESQKKIKEMAGVPPIEFVTNPPNVISGKWAMGQMPDAFMGNDWGETFCDEHKVIINEENPNKRGTVMHELMHADLGCYRENHEETEHQFIYDLAPKLLKTLTDNPQLVTYLFGTRLETEKMEVREQIQ